MCVCVCACAPVCACSTHLCDLAVVPEAGVVERRVAVFVYRVDVRLVVQQLKNEQLLSGDFREFMQVFSGCFCL